MTPSTHRAAALLALTLLFGCPAAEPTEDDAGGGGADAALDAGADASPGEDAGAGEDAGGAQDAGGEDAGADAAEDDAGGPVTRPTPGFGAISGECDVLDDELTSDGPSLVRNAIDFGQDPYDEADKPLLTDGGREIIDDGNAGGSSILSEVVSFELLARCEGATLLKTEKEIVYTDEGKLTDLLVELDGLKIGVSVTRAYLGPNNPYSLEAAQRLLSDKLGDILLSSANVAPEDAWSKQILHVIAYAPDYADFVEQAWEDMDDPDLAGVRADTVVVITVTDGEDGFAY
jgi:hypothetical protein